MAYKGSTCFSNMRDWFNHSQKVCVCGGHNASNYKSNKHHHATSTKLSIRLNRRLKTVLQRESNALP